MLDETGGTWLGGHQNELVNRRLQPAVSFPRGDYRADVLQDLAGRRFARVRAAVRQKGSDVVTDGADDRRHRA